MASGERRQPEAGGESDGGQERPEARRQAAAAAEVPGGAGAALLGETGLALGCCIAAALSWERPLRSLGGFICANLLFWCVRRLCSGGGAARRCVGSSPGAGGPAWVVALFGEPLCSAGSRRRVICKVPSSRSAVL